MNGPASFPKPSNQQEGAQMAKKKTAPPPRWGQEDIDLGEDILAHARKTIDPNVIPDKHTQVTMAARSMGKLEKKGSFENLPSKVKSYLEYVWKLESPEERKKRRDAQLNDEYEMQMKTNPDFLASRHEDADRLSEAIQERDAENVD